MGVRPLYAYLLIAFGIILIAAPLLLLMSEGTTVKMEAVGIVLIGPIPLILSSDDPQSSFLVLGVLAAVIAIITTLILRASRPTGRAWPSGGDSFS
ncbi:MAG: DUF131 domain-containing protein [Aigarchaeota archaeon]|nr:DUF131 domain-containing protein [Candidatus Calditenuaceae archaeon]